MTTPSTQLSSTAAPTAERGARRSFRIGWMPLAIIVVVVVVAAASTYWFTVLRFVQSTDDAYVGGNVTVMAPKVNGFVTELLVTDNQRVKANQVLIRLDSRDYDARLAQADADVQGARAAVAELEAKQQLQAAVINQSQAEVRASAAELTRSASDQVRYRQLVKDEAVSNQVVERADADYLKARATLDNSNAAALASQRQLAVLAAQIDDARARVATAEALWLRLAVS